jgi:Phage gp6-like head-tail connector protein
MALVSMDKAKEHLKIVTSDSDADVQLKLEQASAIVEQYCSNRIPTDPVTPEPPAWTETTVPRPVQAAVLLVLGHLYQNRGDDMETDETLWLAIRRLLDSQRDPVLR